MDSLRHFPLIVSLVKFANEHTARLAASDAASFTRARTLALVAATPSTKRSRKLSHYAQICAETFIVAGRVLSSEVSVSIASC